MSKFLFLHQNFPGQFRHLAPALAARGHEVVGLGERPNVEAQRALAPGVRLNAYPTPKAIADPPRAVARVAAPLQRAHVVASALQQLQRRGFRPDLVYAHIGWGEAVFAKDVFPNSALLLYCEFFYAAKGADVAFDPEFGAGDPLAARMRARLLNAPLLLALEAADAGIAPTEWQRSRFPAHYQPRIRVIHEGIDVERARPDKQATFRIAGKDLVFRPGDAVVTYIARNLEPHRGFHIFMRALPMILERNPHAHVVIVGGDGNSYSLRLSPGQTYRQRALKELSDGVDLGRVHFIPQLPYQEYLALLQVSAAHVYLTYPFWLSWSLLEAMACGCLVIASRTPPVEEVMRDGENGLLVNFFSPQEIAGRVDEALRDGRAFGELRRTARDTVRARFDLRGNCVPAQVSLLEELAARPSQANT